MVTSPPKPHDDLLSVEIDHAHLLNLVVLLTIRALFIQTLRSGGIFSNEIRHSDQTLVSDVLLCVKETHGDF